MKDKKIAEMDPSFLKNSNRACSILRGSIMNQTFYTRMLFFSGICFTQNLYENSNKPAGKIFPERCQLLSEFQMASEEESGENKNSPKLRQDLFPENKVLYI